MKYFIEDTTTRRIGTFPTIPDLIKYMEEVCQRKFGKSRKQWMQDMEDLGHVQNENSAQAFVECMAQEFQIGVVRDNNTKVVCDIFKAIYNSKRKEELGN